MPPDTHRPFIKILNIYAIYAMRPQTGKIIIDVKREKNDVELFNTITKIKHKEAETAHEY